jgi:antitoxin (DNA-binding transcriptional repressor) of toxin-antitoxin stability system
MKVASISELKDGLSAHLDRVRSGEIVVITDRKSPVATLERITPGSLTDTEKRMVSDGIIAPRKELLDVEGLLAMPLGNCPAGLVSALLEERSESR